MLVAEMGFEPHDLRVMSPTSYQAALLRDIWCRRPESNRHGMKVPRDFKSRASTSFATPAFPCKDVFYHKNICLSIGFIHFFVISFSLVFIDKIFDFLLDMRLISVYNI